MMLQGSLGPGSKTEPGPFPAACSLGLGHVPASLPTQEAHRAHGALARAMQRRVCPGPQLHKGASLGQRLATESKARVTALPRPPCWAPALLKPR